MNSSRRYLPPSTHLLCVEGHWAGGPKRAAFWGDPADVGVDKFNHDAHPHPLYQFKLQIQDDTMCCVCGLPITGFAHGCEDCDFFIHDKNCLHLKYSIHHKSHPEHPLRLHPPSHHNICDACLSPARTPFYRCNICDYDLHVDCAELPEMGIDKRGNPIRLCYSFPLGADVRCSVCNGGISKRGWVWYNVNSGYTAHLKCVPPQVVKCEPQFFRFIMQYLLRRRN